MTRSTMIMIDDLPNEVKLRIVAELDDHAARALLSASKGWTAIAESRIWANVLLTPSIDLSHDTAPSDSGSGWADHLRRVLSQAPLPDPVVIFTRQIAAFDAKWDRLLDSLKHDPRRATHIQAVQLSPAINNHKAMLEVFKMIRPAVRSIVARVYFESYSHEITPYHSHPAIIMGQVGSFQSLQKVVIEIPEDPDWLSKMWIMLASTPQLVSLESRGPDYVGDDIGEDRPPGYAETPSIDLVDAMEVNLPKLELLKLEGVQAINLAVNVFRVAPIVSQLDIRLEPHTITRLTAEDLDVFALKDSVTDVVLEGERMTGRLGTYLRAEDQKQLWPSLITYSSPDAWDASAYGNHSQLLARRAYLNAEEPSTYHFTRPSSQVTGSMASWLAEIFTNNPCLLRVQPYFHRYDRDGLNDPWFRKAGGYHVRSYCNGANTLYHLRSIFYDHLGFLMAPHAISYTPGPWAWTFTGPGAFDEAHEGEAHNDRDFYEDLEEGWVDFTFFDGVPLPAALLRWVYDVSEQPGIEWEVGAQGLALADEAWEVLRAWRDEVRVAEGL